MLAKIAIGLLLVNVVYVTYKYVIACYFHYSVEIFKDGNWKILRTYEAKSDAYDTLNQISGTYECIRIVKHLKSKIKKENETVSTSFSKQEILRDYFNS